ncbi:hypothetical protein [Limnohabitans sp.]|uniref:AprA-related methyltransferase n=1 Tax=Limnohabitans sp. TaxID=1907725 RepID=UPI00391A366F
MDKTMQIVNHRVFAHLNGLAIGSVAQGLLETGVLDRLFKDHQKKIYLDGLVANHCITLGYTRLAMETLCLAGLLDIQDEEGVSFSVQVTPRGKAWLNHRRLYRQYNELLTTSLESNAQAYICRISDDDKSTPDDNTLTLVHMHLYAPSICLIMLRLVEQGGQLDMVKDWNSLIWQDILRREGWVSISNSGKVSIPNKVGLLFAPLYAYPISYFPLLRQIPDLLTGEKTNTPTIDRELDINFSGKVFRGPCRDLFLNQLLPLFNTEDVAGQPNVIVDTGCGDATVLIEAYQAIRKETIRGQHLHDYPLLLVGVEYEIAAINVAKQKLQQEGLRHLVIFGDISKPADIHETLNKYNIHVWDILHISKSVVHNRVFTHPNPENAYSNNIPNLNMSYVDVDGQSVSSHSLFNNLVSFFRLWSPWISHHGMIVIESHCWSPMVSQIANDSYPMNLVKTTHNFSTQYLVPAEFYEGAIALSGLVTIKTNSIFAAPGLPPTMTIKHLKNR